MSGSATVQAGLWGERAGDWAELLENPDRPWLGPAYELVLERLVRPGTRLLDVGCGSGRFCVLADRARAQPGGRPAAGRPPTRRTSSPRSRRRRACCVPVGTWR